MLDIGLTALPHYNGQVRKNKISPAQKVVAMGEATGKALEKQKIKKYLMPRSFDDLGLLQSVLTLSVQI